jgi:hypothetical protein
VHSIAPRERMHAHWAGYKALPSDGGEAVHLRHAGECECKQVMAQPAWLVLVLCPEGNSHEVANRRSNTIRSKLYSVMFYHHPTLPNKVNHGAGWGACSAGRALGGSQATASTTTPTTYTSRSDVQHDVFVLRRAAAGPRQGVNGACAVSKLCVCFLSPSFGWSERRQ